MFDTYMHKHMAGIGTKKLTGVWETHTKFWVLCYSCVSYGCPHLLNLCSHVVDKDYVAPNSFLDGLER